MFDEVVGATFDGRIDTKEEVLNEVMRRWSDIPRDEMCLNRKILCLISREQIVSMCQSIAVKHWLWRC